MSLEPSALCCKVCGEPSECKFHYGVPTCHGCKAFFRRTVRLNLVYSCRRGGGCNVGYDQRNACRHCRFEKCIQVGMKKSSVQKQRDTLSTRRKQSTSNQSELVSLAADDGFANSPANSCNADRRSSCPDVDAASLCSPGSSTSGAPPPHQPPSMGHPGLPPSTSSAPGALDPAGVFGIGDEILQLGGGRFEAHVRSNYKQVLEAAQRSMQALNEKGKQLASGEGPLFPMFSSESSKNGFRYLQQHLVNLIEISRKTKPFSNLPIQDQVAIIRSHSTEHLILCAVQSSSNLQDIIALFGGEKELTNDNSEQHLPGVRKLISSILDNLVDPYRRWSIDDTEFVCVKSIALWNPDVVSAESREIVRKCQLMFIIALENYVFNRMSRSPGRFGNLLMLLKSVQTAGQHMKEVIQLGEMFGVLGNTDPLIEDFFRELKAPSSGPLLQILDSGTNSLRPCSSGTSNGSSSVAPISAVATLLTLKSIDFGDVNADNFARPFQGIDAVSAFGTQGSPFEAQSPPQAFISHQPFSPLDGAHGTSPQGSISQRSPQTMTHLSPLGLSQRSPAPPVMKALQQHTIVPKQIAHPALPLVSSSGVDCSSLQTTRDSTLLPLSQDNSKTLASQPQFENQMPGFGAQSGLGNSSYPGPSMYTRQQSLTLEDLLGAGPSSVKSVMNMPSPLPPPPTQCAGAQQTLAQALRNIHNNGAAAAQNNMFCAPESPMSAASQFGMSSGPQQQTPTLAQILTGQQKQGSSLSHQGAAPNQYNSNQQPSPHVSAQLQQPQQAFNMSGSQQQSMARGPQQNLYGQQTLAQVLAAQQQQKGAYHNQPQSLTDALSYHPSQQQPEPSHSAAYEQQKLSQMGMLGNNPGPSLNNMYNEQRKFSTNAFGGAAQQPQQQQTLSQILTGQQQMQTDTRPLPHSAFNGQPGFNTNQQMMVPPSQATFSNGPQSPLEAIMSGTGFNAAPHMPSKQQVPAPSSYGMMMSSEPAPSRLNNIMMQRQDYGLMNNVHSSAASGSMPMTSFHSQQLQQQRPQSFYQGGAVHSNLAAAGNNATMPGFGYNTQQGSMGNMMQSSSGSVSGLMSSSNGMTANSNEFSNNHSQQHIGFMFNQPGMSNNSNANNQTTAQKSTSHSYNLNDWWDIDFPSDMMTTLSSESGSSAAGTTAMNTATNNMSWMNQQQGGNASSFYSPQNQQHHQQQCASGSGSLNSMWTML